MENNKFIIKPDPEAKSPFNNGVFMGWGSALCWWANRVGGDDSMTEKAVRAFYSEDGLSLDIGRYNVGGGDDPAHNHVRRSDSMVPGMWSSFTVKDGRVESIEYNINNDYRQLNVTKKIIAENPSVYIEAFSNSAPYFMTKSGCTGGGEGGGDNLREDMCIPFAEYIARSTRQLRENGVNVLSYSPVNEPSIWSWTANSPKQEGCHFTPGEVLSSVIVETRRALDREGLTDVEVAGLDESSIDDSVRHLPLLTDEAKSALGRIDTHTYAGSMRKELKALAVSMGKDLWMSEVDGGADPAGDYPVAGAMRGAVGIGRRIILDMNEMQPAAWVLWNLIDCFQDKTNPFDRAGAHFNPDKPLWGVSMGDFDSGELKLTMKYYGLGQFTRYITPGDVVIQSTDKTLAAYTPETGEIKIVLVNDTPTPLDCELDLSLFDKVGGKIQAYRTSGSWEDGEKWADVSRTANFSSEKTVSATAKAYSITTFIIS